MYIDELRIGSRYVVNIPDSIRSKLGLDKDSYVFFYERAGKIYLDFFSFDEKKRLVAEGGEISGEYLGDYKIDSKWNFYLTDSLRKKLNVEIGDYLVLYEMNDYFQVVVEKYTERKKRRETQCKK